MGGGIFDHVSHAVARWIDGLSLGAIAATLLGWLPHVAAGLSVIWICLRIANEVLDRRIKQQQHLLNERALSEPPDGLSAFLRKVYDDVTEEEIPPKIKSLLRKLDD